MFRDTAILRVHLHGFVLRTCVFKPAQKKTKQKKNRTRDGYSLTSARRRYRWCFFMHAGLWAKSRESWDCKTGGWASLPLHNSRTAISCSTLALMPLAWNKNNEFCCHCVTRVVFKTRCCLHFNTNNNNNNNRTAARDSMHSFLSLLQKCLHWTLFQVPQGRPS